MKPTNTKIKPMKSSTCKLLSIQDKKKKSEEKNLKGLVK